MKDKIPNQILSFISTFTEFDKHGDITALFTKRYCSIFSYILYKEFPLGEVWWDEDRRHSLFKYNEYCFDITGLTYFSGNGKMVKSMEVL